MTASLVAPALRDLESRVAAGAPLTDDDARRVLAETDLVSLGLLGEMARRRHTGDQVTFGRVSVWHEGQPGARGDAGEIRVTGRPASIDEAVQWTRQAAAEAGDIPVNGFSLADLAALCHRDAAGLGAAAARLREAGLVAVASTPVDGFESGAELIAAVQATTTAGLPAWRLTIERAEAPARLPLIQRVVDLQRALGGARAFAPLPRVDDAATPSTGYDDVRTITLARLLCETVPVIQVDWPLYGPKLAQVAIAFGAGDIDGVDPHETSPLGARRAPLEEIRRQIRDASATPVERDGRYEIRT